MPMQLNFTVQQPQPRPMGFGQFIDNNSSNNLQPVNVGASAPQPAARPPATVNRSTSPFTSPGSGGQQPRGGTPTSNNPCDNCGASAAARGITIRYVGDGHSMCERCLKKLFRSSIQGSRSVPKCCGELAIDLTRAELLLNEDFLKAIRLVFPREVDLGQLPVAIVQEPNRVLAPEKGTGTDQVPQMQHGHLFMMRQEAARFRDVPLCSALYHHGLSGCEGFLQVPVGSKVITEGQEQRQAEKHGWFAAVGGGDGIRGRKRPTATGRGFAWEDPS
ncbi:hypothetical protein EsH8_V_000656 [Colletotrichum jinshuiense]